MQPRRIRILVTLGIAVGAMGEPAQAQFGGLQRTLFRGAYYSGNHNFLSSPQGGPLFDNNIFDQRVEYNRAGQFTLLWNDPALKIWWPIRDPILSERDQGPR